jgi:hypothetical protein
MVLKIRITFYSILFYSILLETLQRRLAICLGVPAERARRRHRDGHGLPPSSRRLCERMRPWG